MYFQIGGYSTVVNCPTLLSCPGNYLASNLINTALWIVSCLDHIPGFMEVLVLGSPFNIKYLRSYSTTGKRIPWVNTDKWERCPIYLLSFFLYEFHFCVLSFLHIRYISGSLGLFHIMEKYWNREFWYIPGDWSLCIPELVIKMSVLMQKFPFNFQIKNTTFAYHEIILTSKETTVILHLCKGEDVAATLHFIISSMAQNISTNTKNINCNKIPYKSRI